MGDLLELLRRASSSFRTLRATVHQRTDDTLMHQAVVQHYPEQPTAVPFDRMSRVIEFVERIWTDERHRWRIERASARGDGKDPAVTVIDGTRWWLYSAETGAISNEDEPETGLGTRSVAEPLLEPSPLIQASDLHVTGRVTHAGRDAISVSATPGPMRYERPPRPSPFWLGDRHELIVDAERGIILRDTGLLNGRTFWLTDMLEVVFDEPFDEHVFVFEPPAGVELKKSFYPRPRPVSIHEAVRLAPFTVFMPSHVPEGMRAEVSYQPGQDRPPMPPSISIQLSAPDGKNITVNQLASALVWERDRSADEWEELAGEQLWFSARSRFQAEPAVRAEREGTTIFVHGPADRETLLQIARSLAPHVV